MKFSSAYQILFGCFTVGCIASAGAGGSCINRITLLTGFYNLVQNNNRINASTSIQGYPPWNVRMSSNGWCSVSLGSMCEGNISRAMEQYLLVDFGAEVVVEAIGTAAADNETYLEGYMVEYARSDGQFFTALGEDGTLFDGNDACTQTEQVRQFGTPVIARYIRIVPMEWVGPMICFKMELYGCFVRECPEVSNLSDNQTLLPDANVYESSTYSLIVGTQDDVREAWCSQGTDNAPSVVLTFTQPLYITYATTRGVSIYWLREYSYITIGSSGRSTYVDVDGTSVYGQTDNGMYTVVFWEPIDASVVELRIDNWVPIFACVGIKLYGCVSSEAVDHSILLLSTTTVNAPTISTSITFSNMVVSLSMSTTLVEPTAAICASPQAAVTTSTLRISTFPTTTVTVTSTVSATQSQCITVTISPSAAQSSNQQITDKSDTSCNAIAICIPVAMVIAVVVCVIVFMAVWRLRHKAIYNFVTSNPQMAKIYNDLYGENKNIIKTTSVSSYKGNETSSLSTTDLRNNDSRRDFVKPEYVTADEQQVTVISAVTTTIKDDPALTYNPAYCINNRGPPLSDNPAYITMKDGSPPATDSDPAIDQIYI